MPPKKGSFETFLTKKRISSLSEARNEAAAEKKFRGHEKKSNLSLKWPFVQKRTGFLTNLGAP